MTEEDKTKESPDTDKTLELTDEKPPVMGEGEELVEGKEGEETTASIIEQAEEETLSPELEAIMKKKGFKDLGEFAKAYEASEKKQTELEKDARLRSLTEVPPRPKAERTLADVPVLTKDPYDMSKEEFDAYQGQREKAVEQRLVARYEDAEADKKWDREYRETMAVVNKDPKRFGEIKPQLQELHAKYPDAPMSEIYPVADEMEKAQSQSNRDKFIRDTFGANVDVDKLKTIVSKVRPAEIAGAGGAGAMNVNKTGQQKADEDLWSDIEKADKIRE